MKQRWILKSAVIGTLGASAALPIGATGQTQPTTAAVITAAPASATPTTAPAASQPSGASIEQLIKQLGSDDPTDRDAAQQQLASRGSAAVDALKDAAAHNDDLEVRSRAASALAKIGEHTAFDTSPITLHLKDAPQQDAMNAIAAQAHAQFTGPAGMGIPVVAGGKMITIDADQKPFWDVMTDLCQQMNVCPTLEPPTKNTLRLFPTPRNWFLESPHQIVGPYWIGVAGENRTRTIDLMGPQRTDDLFTMQFIVYPEPKLAVTQISDFNLKEATDDAGNSLMPTAAAPRAAAMAVAMAGLARSTRTARPTLHTVEAKLTYPEHPGKRIATLRGDVAVTIAEGVQQFVVDDVLGTPKQTNPINRCNIKVTVTHSGPDFFQVIIECTRDGMLDEQWLAIANRVNDITMEDADGKPLTMSYVTTATYSDTSFKSTALFNKNVFAPQQQLLNRQIVSRTGDAKRLTWNIATRLKVVTVPVTFHDLPMP